LVSLGALPDDLKTIFSKLMTQVYSFKQKSQELVIKVPKEFANYESSSDPHIASPKMAAALGNVNGFHQPHDSQVLLQFVFMLFLFIHCFFICNFHSCEL